MRRCKANQSTRFQASDRPFPFERVPAWMNVSPSIFSPKHLQAITNVTAQNGSALQRRHTSARQCFTCLIRSSSPTSTRSSCHRGWQACEPHRCQHERPQWNLSLARFYECLESEVPSNHRPSPDDRGLGQGSPASVPTPHFTSG
jgi:hypothetical protein